jgi:hypothetical protein
MKVLEIAEEIAEGLRQEPYHLFRNDCLIKSLRFRSKCREIGIKAHLVFCVIGIAKAKLPILREVKILYSPHFWGEVKGQRFETSRPLGSHGHFGIVPSKIRPILTVKLG